MEKLRKYSIDNYQDYLSDESRMKGNADSISFPSSADEVCSQIRELACEGIPVTVQGARTGITGAAVPVRGHIMNMSRFSRITGMSTDSAGNFFVTCEPGVILSDLNSHLSLRNFDTSDWSEESREALKKFRACGRKMHFPPDPTEKSATVGGMFSCNSRGLNSMSCGSAADYAEAVEICTPAGERWNIERGKYIFDEKGCPLPDGGRLDVPCTHASSVLRNLCPVCGTDLVDLFAGSEGMLGAVLSLKLRLEPEKESLWGVVFFLKDTQSAGKFAGGAAGQDFGAASLDVLEFYDSASLLQVSRMKQKMSSLRSIPDFPENTAAAVYVEISCDDEGAIEEAMLGLMDEFDACGGQESDTWASCFEKDLEMFRLLRHAVPESVNTCAAETALKGFSCSRISLDCQLPASASGEMLELYEQGIEKASVHGMVFGHYGDGRLHVELMPENEAEHERASGLAEEFSEAAVKRGGIPAGENGTGKVKLYIYSLAEPGCMENAGKIKKFFDPEGIFNPGNF